MNEFNVGNQENRKELILDFILKLFNHFPNLNKDTIKYKLLDFTIINSELECNYYIEALPSSNAIVIDPKRIGEASDEGIIFLHQLMRVLSNDINELNDGIIEEILSKLYPKEDFYNFLDEKVVADLLVNVFGLEELLNGLFDGNKNLEIIASQKLNYEGFISELKIKMAANKEEIRYYDPEKPLSSLVEIIIFIFDAYLNGNDVSINDLELFKEIVKEWRTEIMTDNEEYPESNIYPGINDIIIYINLKIEERRKQQL